jgi:protocatechuate 3,4-dioxygenase beta subunit
MSRHHHHDASDLHDRGLQFDLETLISRRNAMRSLGAVLGVAAVAAVIGCGDNSGGGSRDTSSRATNPPDPEGGASTSAAGVVDPIPTTSTPASACVPTVPEETAGPFPGNGSNGPNALAQSGIVRSDIRPSFGTSNKVATGVPLTVRLTVVDTANGCKPMPGAAVYVWHCDQAGNYSMYSQAAVNENYLRGVQEADANGVVTFRTVFPAAYLGRWPHIHFEIYPNLAGATSSQTKLATSQLALPEDVCNAVYATPGYEQSVRNMAQTPLSRDMVFADGWDLQMATVTGNVQQGYAASLIAGV